MVEKWKVRRPGAESRFSSSTTALARLPIGAIGSLS
jgi:hypothetical protein